MQTESEPEAAARQSAHLIRGGLGSDITGAIVREIKAWGGKDHPFPTRQTKSGQSPPNSEISSGMLGEHDEFFYSADPFLLRPRRHRQLVSVSWSRFRQAVTEIDLQQLPEP